MKLLYVLLLLLAGGTALSQVHGDLYSLEKEGDRLLQAGRFSEAIRVYEKYRVVSGGRPYEEMDRKIANVRDFMVLHNEGQVAVKAGRFSPAIEKWSSYRKLFPGMSIKPVDAEIERALVESQRSRYEKTLEEKDRIILGFELNYQAERAFETGDFAKAADYYERAVAGVKQVRQRNSVAELANRRLSQLRRSIDIAGKLPSVGAVADKLTLLESYRSYGGIIVLPFEEKITVFRAETERPDTPETIAAALRKRAGECELSTLMAHVRESKWPTIEGVSKDSLYAALSDLNRHLSEIENIGLRGDESQRDQFVFSGFETLIRRSRKIPLVGENISVCIRQKYEDLLLQHAERIFEQGKDLNVARNMTLQALQTAASAGGRSRASALLQKINSWLGCENIIKTQLLALNTIQTNLDNCLLETARTHFQKVESAVEGCLTPRLEERLRFIREKINTLEQKSARQLELKTAIELALTERRCADVDQHLIEIQTSNGCQDPSVAAYISRIKTETEACRRKSSFALYIGGVKSLLEEASARPADPAAAEKALHRAEETLDEAQKLRKDDEEQREIDALKGAIVSAREQTRNRKKGGRYVWLREYRSLVKPEVHVAAVGYLPRIQSGYGSVRTNTYLPDNVELGMNVRFIKRGRGVNASLGIRYARNSFDILDDKDWFSEGIKADFLGLEGKLMTGSPEARRLYFALHGGVQVPVQTTYYQTYRTNAVTYSGANPYVNTHLFFGGSLGYENQLRNRGFSVEVFARAYGFLPVSGKAGDQFPLLKYQNFRFAQNLSTHFNTSALALGIALTCRFW